MKLIFINRYFFPDQSATAQILTELAFELAARGIEVHVVASRQRYEDARASLPRLETIEGVRVHRIRTTSFGRRNLLGRAIDYLSFYISSYWTLSRLLNQDDVMIAKTDPPLISVVASLAAYQRRAKMVNWLQDVFPEVAIKLEVGIVKGPLGSFAKKLRDRSLRRASANVVLGERMAEVISNVSTVPPEIIQNWAVGSIRAIERHENEVRHEWQLGQRFVVGYSGNFGRAHEFDTVLRAMESFRDQDRIVFSFIGGGAQFETLRNQVVTRGLTSIAAFHPYQPKERLSHSLGAADVHLVSLQPCLEGLIVPSKFYGIAAAGRPTIFIGDLDGEIARQIRHFNCGVSVRAGDSSSLAATIRVLQENPDLCDSLGRNARLVSEQFLGREHAVAKWESLLRKVSQNPKAPLP